MEMFLFLFALVVIVAVIIMVKTKEKYPRFVFSVDITGKRGMTFEKAFTMYFDLYGTAQIEGYLYSVEKWKKNRVISFNGNQKKIDKFNLWCERESETGFRFEAYRTQTKYKQVNYVRHPYKDEVLYYSAVYSHSYITSLVARKKKNREID